MEPFTPVWPVPTPPPAITENFDPVERSPFCPQCCENYERERAKLTAIQKSFSEASLPQWLQNAKLNAGDNKTEDQSKVCSVPMQTCSKY